MALDPSAPAVEFEDHWWTWSDVASAADAVDAALRDEGLGAGCAVGVMLRNRPSSLGAFLGLLRAARVSSPSTRCSEPSVSATTSRRSGFRS